jgi:ArsR family transcriptional regulator
MRTLPVLTTLPPRPAVRLLADLLKVLADEHRLAMVALLARGELCVCHLTEILDMPQSTVSHHMGVLRRAGLIRDRRDERDGRWTYYALDPAALAVLREQLTAVLALDGIDAMATRPAPPCP